METRRGMGTLARRATHWRSALTVPRTAVASLAPMRRLSLVCLLALACLGVASVADAQVRFDDSPSKKEYGLPLERAREYAGARAGGTHSRNRGEDTARGSKGRSRKARAAARDRARRARADGQGADARRDLFGRGIAPDARPPGPAVAAQTGGTSAALWSALAALAVLVAGLVAFTLRRRRLRGD